MKIVETVLKKLMFLVTGLNRIYAVDVRTKWRLIKITSNQISNKKQDKPTLPDYGKFDPEAYKKKHPKRYGSDEKREQEEKKE